MRRLVADSLAHRAGRHFAVGHTLGLGRALLLHPGLRPHSAHRDRLRARQPFRPRPQRCERHGHADGHELAALLHAGTGLGEGAGHARRLEQSGGERARLALHRLPRPSAWRGHLHGGDLDGCRSRGRRASAGPFHHHSPRALRAQRRDGRRRGRPRCRGGERGEGSGSRRRHSGRPVSWRLQRRGASPGPPVAAAAAAPGPYSAGRRRARRQRAGPRR
mmetsp:Transcript_53268/g.149549  ORF Transcript_53268/g.149549 Transcript_53268/m.149549 type:complete len:219 (-) Transcript_53268:418-1074(-)